MLNLVEKQLCTGCAACANVCKEDAITMHRDEKGFLYPVVNYDKCISCMRCQNICPVEKTAEFDTIQTAEVFAMRSKDTQLRMRSTSGGIFSELAEVILEAGGAVAGASYKADWAVKHKIVEKKENLDEIRRSKYQQSEVGYVFRDIKKQLEYGRKILFCGTPCQAAGLKAYLNRDYENLYICDFICRGVPSPLIFKKYIEHLQTIYASDVSLVWMKHKENGWHSLTTVIEFENGGRYIKEGYHDSYVQLYLKYNVGMRSSCFDCRFKGGKSVADITLGDFWGLEKTELDDNMGTSCVICRTERGKKIVEKIKEKNVYKKMNVSQIRQGNPCLFDSVKRSDADEETFFKIMGQNGFEKAVEWLVQEEKKKHEA